MFKIKRINKEEVKPVRFLDEEEDERPVRGRDIFPEIYANIFFCARKKSGKTCSIYHIIEKCSTKETRVIAFVSTLHRDPTWRAIKRMCEKKGIDFTGFTSLKEGKEDILQDIVDTLENEIEIKGEDEEEEVQHGRGIVMPCEQEEEEESKPKKPKEKAPEIIFVFDDLSGQLSSPSIVELLKKNRHFKTKVLISSQYWNDIPLEGRGQINYVLLFRGLSQSKGKLEEIYRNLDLSVPFEVFLDIYKFCTSKQFNFMYIDVINTEFRKNLTHKIDLTDLDL